MIAHLTRCLCGTCQQLDRLPARRQGIPGAVQMTFDHAAGSGAPLVYAGDGRVFELVAMTADELRSSRPGGPIPTADVLPLFVGALEPTLF